MIPIDAHEDRERFMFVSSCSPQAKKFATKVARTLLDLCDAERCMEAIESDPRY